MHRESVEVTLNLSEQEIYDLTFAEHGLTTNQFHRVMSIGDYGKIEEQEVLYREVSIFSSFSLDCKWALVGCLLTFPSRLSKCLAGGSNGFIVPSV